MNWRGVVTVEMSTVHLPDGFELRREDPRIKKLAQSIERNGLIALPVVRESTMELVAGSDRFAALMFLGYNRHEVRMVEGTDAEMERVTIEENLMRRRGDDYDALTARLVELTAETVATPNKTDEEEARKPGPPRSARRIAREEVAEATGRTPEAIRQAEVRARAAEAPPAPDAPMPPPVDCFDLELADAVVRDWFPRVRVTQEVLRDVQRKLEASQRRLTSDLKTGANIQATAYSRTYQAVHDADYAVRLAMPESICPWCKAQPILTPQCSGCQETGFVSLATLEGVAPGLLERGSAAKVPDGRGGFKLLAKPPKAEPPKKKITIVIERVEPPLVVGTSPATSHDFEPTEDEEYPF